MTKLNPLDQFVREGMLRSPSIFPTRVSVLRHAYLVLGNGYDWVDGKLQDRFSKKFDGKMSYDYLPTVFEKGDPFYHEASYENQVKRRDEEVAARKEREANIDSLATLCTTDLVFRVIHENSYENSKTVIRGFKGGYKKLCYSTLGEIMLLKTIDPSFFNGGIEVLDIVIRSFPEDYDKLIAIRKKLTDKFGNDATPSVPVQEIDPEPEPEPIVTPPLPPIHTSKLDSFLAPFSDFLTDEQKYSLTDEAINADIMAYVPPKTTSGQDAFIAATMASLQQEINFQSKQPKPTPASRPDNLRFREDFSRGHVVVLDGDTELYRNSEYITSAKWAQRKFSLSDADLMVLYRDYKDDYDND